MKLFTATLEDKLKEKFYVLGKFIALHPKKVVVAVLALTVLSSLGLLRFHEWNNPRDTFTSSDEPARDEWKIVEGFIGNNQTLDIILLLFQTKDGKGFFGNADNLSQMTQLIAEIAAIQVINHRGENVTFQDMSGRFKKQILAPQLIALKYDGLFGSKNITYPWFDNKDDIEAEESDDNDEEEPEDPTEIAKLFNGFTAYNVDFYPGTNIIKNYNTTALRLFMSYEDKQTMFRWEAEVYNLIYDSDRYPALLSGMASENIIGKEVKKIGDDIAPLFAVVFLILTLFQICCAPREDPRKSKFLECLLGCGVPLLATVTTLGLVIGAGLAFQSIIVSSVFLLLAIGFDDLFIMLSGWHRTPMEEPIAERIAHMLQNSGVSMTVTTVTNMISFSIGATSKTSALQTFSIFSAVASFVVFVYQMLMFPAILTIFSYREYRELKEGEISLFRRNLFGFLSRLHDAAFRRLARLVVHPCTAVITIGMLVLYWCISIYGVSVVISDMDLKDLADKDSQISQFKYRWDDSQQDMQSGVVIVQHPGDLREPANRDRIKKLFSDFYKHPNAVGPNSTICWFQMYLEYLEMKGLPFTYEYVDSFITTGERAWVNGTFDYNQDSCERNEPDCIGTFLCLTGFNHIARDREMYGYLLYWRELSKNYTDLGVVLYSERTDFADQTEALKGFLWQTLIAETICMGLSFIFFIPETNSIAAAVFSVFSVNLGVFGILSLWGVGVDPFSIAALLMSIGFSVDISAHISYHFYESHAADPRERLEFSFLSIGLPSAQGSLCTLLAIIPILFRPCYLTAVFSKTILLVTVFGFLHGLLVLPVLLTILTKWFGRKRLRRIASINKTSTEITIIDKD